MSLPNLASDSGDRRDPVAMPLDAPDESASVPREEPGYRAAALSLEAPPTAILRVWRRADALSALPAANPGQQPT